MNKLYFWLFVILAFIYGAKFILALFFLSLLIACIPLMTSWFFFLLPIIITTICFFTGHATLAWWSIIFAPWHYMMFMANILNAIKNLFNN